VASRIRKAPFRPLGEPIAALQVGVTEPGRGVLPLAKELESTTFDRAWIGRWVKKMMEERALGPAEIGRQCGVSSQRISQITGGGDPPSLDLLWRLAALFADEEEFSALSEDSIRAVLERLVVSLSPRRLLYLFSLPSSEAQTLADAHELRRAGAERLRTPRGQDDEPEKS